jgi:sugar-specific transcriptional regulator TrmB
MSEELAEVDFQRFWRRLQQLGLNAYESRSYLVLLGHPRFKALELAARAHVPRQKIYEVLDSLVEKGFAQVVQEKTKLFSAVEPSLAIPGYLARKRQSLEQELTDNGRAGGAMIEDLKSLYSEGQGGRGTLDFLRIVTEPAQTAAEYRRMLAEVKHEYLEFSRPPYAVDPLDEKLVKQAVNKVLPLMEQTQARLDYKMDEKDTTIRGDEAHLELALVNLLENGEGVFLLARFA